MTNVVNIEDFRKEPPSNSVWIGDVSFFLDEDGGASCVIRENNDDLADNVADRIRVVAEAMFQCAWLATKSAHKEQVNADGDLLCVAWAFENGGVRVQVDDERLVTPEHFEWVDDALDSAKEAARL